METRSGDFAAAIGLGLVSGLAGTAVMTAAQLAEMAVTGREGSTTPADAVERVLDLEPRDEAAHQRLAQLVHFAYGTGWGAARGALGWLGLRGPAAAASHFALVWGTALVMLPALDLAPPPRQQGGKALAQDAAFHAVYAAGVAAAWEWLERHRGHDEP